MSDVVLIYCMSLYARPAPTPGPWRWCWPES